MKKGTVIIAFLAGLLGLGLTGTALAQSSNSPIIVLQPSSGNQQIQRGDDGMQNTGVQNGGSEHEGMAGDGHSGSTHGSGGMGGEGGGGDD